MNVPSGDLWLQERDLRLLGEGPVAPGEHNTSLIRADFLRNGSGQYIFKIFLRVLKSKSARFARHRASEEISACGSYASLHFRRFAYQEGRSEAAYDTLPARPSIAPPLTRVIAVVPVP